MKYTRRISWSAFAAVALLLMLVCGIVFAAPQTAVAEETAAQANELKEMGDYSSYTDNILPEKMDEDDIEQYVPAELFNSGGPYVHYGKEYGFVIYEEARVKYVNLFTAH